MKRIYSEREKIDYTCKECGEPFKSSSARAVYCSKQCRDEEVLREKSNALVENGKAGEDYVICQICKKAVISIFPGHLKLHEGWTSEAYKAKFHGHATQSKKLLAEKGDGGKIGGARMREPEYKEMLSERAKGENNPMHRTKTTDEYRRSLSPFSPAFYEKRYPELTYSECQVLANQKSYSFEKTSWTQKSYWIKMGFNEADAIKNVSELQRTFSLDICIKKLGEEAGLARWKQRQELWKSKVFNDDVHIGRGRSKVSEKLFEEIKNELGKENCADVLDGANEKSFWDKDKKKCYKFDFTKVSSKRIIEFNGDYWHCNPAKYEPSYHHKIKDASAEEIWNYDDEKINVAKENGYTVLTIWEQDFRNDPDKVIDICINFINGEI